MSKATATIAVERLEVEIDPPSVLFHGTVAGDVVPGMLIHIPFNNSFSMTCEITRVQYAGKSVALVVLADDAEEAEFLASFNAVKEVLKVELP